MQTGTWFEWAQIYHQSEVAFLRYEVVLIAVHRVAISALLCPAYWQAVIAAPIRCKPKRLSAFQNIANDVRRKEREFDHLLDASL